MIEKEDKNSSEIDLTTSYVWDAALSALIECETSSITRSDIRDELQQNVPEERVKPVLEDMEQREFLASDGDCWHPGPRLPFDVESSQ